MRSEWTSQLDDCTDIRWDRLSLSTDHSDRLRVIATAAWDLPMKAPSQRIKGGSARVSQTAAILRRFLRLQDTTAPLGNEIVRGTGGVTPVTYLSLPVHQGPFCFVPECQKHFTSLRICYWSSRGVGGGWGGGGGGGGGR